MQDDLLDDSSQPNRARSERVVFKLSAYTVSPPVKYPYPADEEVLGYFSTLEAAEGFMRSELELDDSPDLMEQPDVHEANEHVLRFEIEEIEMDVRRLIWATYIYDDAGRQFDVYGFDVREQDRGLRPFAGRYPQDCRYKKGDLVQFLDKKTLKLGIVLRLPLNPDEVERRNAIYRANMRQSPPSVATVECDDTYWVLHADEGGFEILPENALGLPVAEVDEACRLQLTKLLHECEDSNDSNGSPLPYVRNDDLVFSHFSTENPSLPEARAIFLTADFLHQLERMDDTPQVDLNIIKQMASAAARIIAVQGFHGDPADDPYDSYFVVTQSPVPAIFSGKAVSAYVGFPMVWCLVKRPRGNWEKFEPALKKAHISYDKPTAGILLKNCIINSEDEDRPYSWPSDRIKLTSVKVDADLTSDQAKALAHVIIGELRRRLAVSDFDLNHICTYEHNEYVECNVYYSSETEHIYIDNLYSRLIFV